jgi:hypothetical protein
LEESAISIFRVEEKAAWKREGSLMSDLLEAKVVYLRGVHPVVYYSM